MTDHTSIKLSNSNKKENKHLYLIFLDMGVKKRWKQMKDFMHKIIIIIIINIQYKTLITEARSGQSKAKGKREKKNQLK